MLKPAPPGFGWSSRIPICGCDRGCLPSCGCTAGDDTPRLWVPSEAIIRSGTRNLVIVAADANRFEPTDVRIGPEAGGKTVILSGLEEGQKVVASGQFLIDSEASLRGVLARLNSTGSTNDTDVRGTVEKQGASHD